MGLSLLEAAKQAGSPAEAAVIRELGLGELTSVIPFRNVTGGFLDYMKESDLPSVGFRGINEAYDASLGVINPEIERVKILGGECDVDTFLLRTQGGEARSRQVQMHVAAMRHTFEDLFINGNSGANPRQFDGLETRLNTGSSQAIDMGTAALSMSTLDELVDAVEAPGAEKVLIMNKKMRRRINAAVRAGTVDATLQTTKIELGRFVTVYNGMRIICPDTNAYGTDILPFDEGGGSNETSIYCVAFGDNLTTGIQDPMGVMTNQLGEVPDAPVDRTRIEWYCGAAVLNGRSCARIYGITDAAVVA